MTLLLLTGLALASDWYRVRLTVYSPDDELVGNVTASGSRVDHALHEGRCVLAGDRRFYELGEVYELRLRDRDGGYTGEVRRCTVEDHGVVGQFALDLLVADDKAVHTWVNAHAKYQDVRRVR